MSNAESQALARSVFFNGLAFFAVMVALSATVAWNAFQVAASCTYVVGTLEREVAVTRTQDALDRLAAARRAPGPDVAAYRDFVAAASALGKGQPWVPGRNLPAEAASKVRVAGEAWHQARPAHGQDPMEQATRDALAAYQAAEVAEAHKASAQVDEQIRRAGWLGALRALLALAFFVLLGTRQYRLLSRAFEAYKAQVHSLATELAARNEELERRVEERTHELAEARDVAQRANDAKSTFLANFSHELRTPLNAIIGYSEMLVEEAGDGGHGALVPDLEKINGSGRHLLGLIDDVLDLSKIEAGKMDLHLEPLDLHRLVAEVVDTIGPMATKRGNALTVEVDAEPAVVQTDAKKLKQCIFNLMANACKFTEGGRVDLHVAVAPDGVLTCRVSDTGIGMSSEQVGRLFQAFNQADSSITRRYGGTGLGLAISQHFCKLLGGKIEVESQPGCGSTFTLRVPVEVGTPVVP